MWWVAPAGEGDLETGVWFAVIQEPGTEIGVEEVNFVNVYDPPSDVPKTGDESRLALWSLMMAVSAAALGAVLTMSRKRRRS